MSYHHNNSVAFASIRDNFRQKQNEQASRKLSHRLLVGPDTRRASNVQTVFGKNSTNTTVNNTSAATKVSTTMATEDALIPSLSSSSSSSGSGFGVEFVVADLTVMAERLEQVCLPSHDTHDTHPHDHHKLYA